MKTVIKSLVSLILLIAFSVGLHAQQAYRLMHNDSKKIQLRLNSTTLSSVEVKTELGNFSRLMMDQFHSSVQVGDPELPTLVKLIEIPLCDDIELRVTPGEFIIYDAAALDISYPVFPAQPSYEKSYEGPITLIKNDSTYEQNRFFAAVPLVTVNPIGQMRDYNLAELTFSPVSYNPVTEQFKVYQSVEVEIRFVNSRPEETAAMKRLYSTPMMGVPASLLMNPTDPQPAELEHNPIKMVIVSDPMFEAQLAPFIEWKKRKGFIVDLALTSNPNVGTTTTTIKNYLQAQYDNATETDPAPTFVLFVGDVAQIPTFQGATGIHVTDLYYVTYTAGDYLPDAYYGRFSANNAAQLAPQLEKTLMYEMYTMPDPTYLDDAVLVAGTDDYWSPTHANGQVNYLSDNYINTGYGYSNIYKHLYPATSQAALIRQKIGNGVGFANYTAHCTSAGWSDPSFEIHHVSSMNNENKYGLIIGNCCQSGMFDNSACFAEMLLRADKKGAMAYIGASNSTYWNEDFYWTVGLRSIINANPTYQPNNLGAYDRLFHTHNEDHSEWMVSNMAICKAGNLAVQSSTSGRKKYYWEVYHLFGDPSVISYLTQPDEMNVTAPTVLTTGISSMSLTAAPYAYVALVKNGVLIGANFADAIGTVTLTFDPLTETGEYELAAWGQNYQQYFDTINVIDPSGAGCLTPIGITYSGVTTTSVDIEWVDLVTANSWKIEYGVSGFTQGTGTVVQVTTNPATITGLAAATDYDFYLKAVCAPGEESNWSQKQTFRTNQIPVNVPFTIDFETESGFSFVNNPSGVNWYIGSATGVNNTTGGNNGLYISGDNGVTNMYDNTPGVVWAYRDIYFTPSGTDYVLTFDWKCLGEEYFDYFNLYIGPPSQPVASGTGTIMVPEGATPLATMMGQQNSWTEASYILYSYEYSGQTQRLYFCWKNNGSTVNQPPVAIDNITLKVVSCFTPLYLYPYDETANSVTLDWYEMGDATAWEIEYGAPGFTTGTIVSAPTNPFTLTGLNTYTAYEARVRAVCDVDDYSTWSERMDFVTGCGTLDLPFFDDFTYSPDCWTQTYSGGITSERWWHSWNGTQAGGSAGEFQCNWTNAVGVSRLISPLIRFDNVAAGELSFKHYYNNATPGVILKLQCSPDLVTWTDLSFSHSGGSISATTEVVQFVPLADSLYFAWMIDGDHYSINYWYIDDVSIIELSGCLMPTQVSYSNVSATSVTLDWNENGTATEWEVEYGAPGFTTGTIVTASTKPFTLTGLNHSTMYEVRVRAVCNANEYSTWSSRVSFPTLCLATELPFLEDFTTAPICWTQTYSGGISSNRWSHIPDGTQAGGTAGEMRATYAYGVGVSRLISPLIRFDNAAAAELIFKHHYNNYIPGVILKVQCSPDLVTWTDLSFSHSGGTIFATTEVVQFIPVADSLYFAWMVDGNHDHMNFWFLDDISITAMSPCFTPTAINYYNVTTSSVDIGWANPMTAVSWEIEYGESGFTQGTGTILPTTTNPITITGLTQSTCYDFYVRAICTPGEVSNWSLKRTFCTSQIPADVPFVIDFETESGFEFVNNPFGSNWYIGNAPDVNNTTDGSHGLYISSDEGATNSYDNLSAVVWAYRDIYFTPSVSDYTLSFDWKCYGETRFWSAYDYFNVYIGTPSLSEANFTGTITVPSGATVLDSYLNNQTTWQDTSYILPVADYSGQIKRLYFCWRNNSDRKYLPPAAIDNIEVTSTGIVDCFSPTNLSISNISPTGAIATWTAGGAETSWQIEYKTAETITWTTQVVTTSTYSMTGLQPSTNYQVRVKSLCDAGVVSPYTSVVSFTTLAPSCVAPTNLAISNISSTGATATWTAGGSETSWHIEYKTAAATNWTVQAVTTPNYTMTGLESSTNYQVRVRSLCDAGVVSPYTAVVSFTTLAPPCVAPINLAISNISSTGATATWTAGGSETSWQIEYKTAAATTWTTQVVHTPTYTMTGLQPSTTYEVRVKSLCGTNVESPYTTIVPFTTSAPPCVAPTNLAISNISSTGATATWTAGSSETSWQIEYKTAVATTWTTQVVNTPTYTMIGLQPSTDYEVKVKSLCDGGAESDYTDPVPFTTDAIPTYTITATAGPHGTITPSGDVTVNQGASQTFTFTPEAGYLIDVVLVDNVPQIPVPESYTFENIQANHTIHVDFAEGITENELSQYVTLYPNPTQSLIDLKLDRDYLGTTECRIYDMYGKLMLILPIEEDITTIDVSDFAAGVYFVRLTTEQGQVSKRFVKQ